MLGLLCMPNHYACLGMEYVGLVYSLLRLCCEMYIRDYASCWDNRNVVCNPRQKCVDLQNGPTWERSDPQRGVIFNDRNKKWIWVYQ